jgi:hypothetical protein
MALTADDVGARQKEWVGEARGQGNAAVKSVTAVGNKERRTQ